LAVGRPRALRIIWVVLLIVVGAIDTQDAFDPADHATNGTADDGTDRARTPVTFIHAIRNAAGDALRLSRQWRDERHRKASACDHQFEVHLFTPLVT